MAKLPKVLLVEDAPFLRYAFGRLLRLNGFDVMEATDGKQALDHMDHFRPQVIITDVQMPEMDGVELIRRVRSNPRTADMPILAITADATDQTELRVRQAGAADYLVKPIDFPELVDRLRALKLSN